MTISARIFNSLFFRFIPFAFRFPEPDQQSLFTRKLRAILRRAFFRYFPDDLVRLNQLDLATRQAFLDHQPFTALFSRKIEQLSRFQIDLSRSEIPPVAGKQILEPHEIQLPPSTIPTSLFDLSGSDSFLDEIETKHLDEKGEINPKIEGSLNEVHEQLFLWQTGKLETQIPEYPYGDAPDLTADRNVITERIKVHNEPIQFESRLATLLLKQIKQERDEVIQTITPDKIPRFAGWQKRQTE